MSSNWKFDRAFFFREVRKSVFGNTLTQGQVDNLSAILDALEAEDVRNPYWVGAVFGTARMEVGPNMSPVREGFAATDKGAKAAVTKLFNAGKISTNYGKTDPKTGQSYYGRGYAQITHKENYLKVGQAMGLGDKFVKNPDELLKASVAARAMIVGMKQGLFRKKSLQSELGTFPTIPTRAQMFNSRDIINGDKNKRSSPGARKLGDIYADFLEKFANAVRIVDAMPALPPAPAPVNVAAALAPLASEDPEGYNPPSIWKRIRAFFNL